MKRAFTLIEILVVIAIIAILAAILFPVFARATERARCVHCMSNLRQIGTATGNYLNDWNQKYPWAEQNGYWTLPQPRPSFPDTLQGYVFDQRIFQCPSDSGEVYFHSSGSWLKRTKPWWTMNYMNYGYPGTRWAAVGPQIAGIAAAKLKHPATTVLLWEGRPWHGYYDSNAANYTYDVASYNVLYCDTHVRPRTYKQWYTDMQDSMKP